MGISRHPARLSSLGRLAVWWLVPLVAFGPGCSRRFFREQAEREGMAILAEKEHPAWDLKGYHLYPDPRARFADTTNPDRPPMPPDDPAAMHLSPNPQKPHKVGVTLVEGVGYLDMLDCWDRQNRAELEARRQQRKMEEEREEKAEGAADKGTGAAEPLPPPVPDEGEGKEKENGKGENKGKPNGKGGATEDEGAGVGGQGGAPLSPQQVLERSEALARRELAEIVTTKGILPEEQAERAVSKQRAFLLKLEQAVELGLVNSREYQTRREQLYLAALPVSVERFAFAPQFFAAETLFRERFGRQAPDGPVNRWRAESTFGFTKLFSTGALLLVRFANQTIFNIGTRPDTSVSTLALDLIQPLLRGGGKAVTLEPLTQAERNLLYVLRDFARFRQEFFVYIAAGQSSFIPGVQAGVQALSSGTVSLPGRFIPGATPIVSSAIALGLAPQVVPGNGLQLNAINPGNAPPQGYFSTIVDKATLVNQYRNIQSLRRFLDLFRVYLEGGIVNSVQVGQVEQQLLRSTASALNQQVNFRNGLDQLKLQLGIPPNVKLEVDDEYLQPIFDVVRGFEDLSAEYDTISYQASLYGKEDEVDQIRPRLRKLLFDSAFLKRTEFRKQFPARLERWTNYSDKELETELGRLRRERDVLREKAEAIKDREGGELSEADAKRLEALEDEVSVGSLEEALRNYLKRPWRAEKDPARRLDLQNRLFLVVYRYFLSVLEEPFRERSAKVRGKWPELPAICVDGVDLLQDDDDAVLAAVTRAALNNRLDLMNQRAELVDSWRKIKVAANALMGVLNVQYHYDVSSPRNDFSPFNLGGSRFRHQLAVNAEPPFVRVTERNNYRAALIAYQQQRRALQASEDQVLFAVRLSLRALRATANNYHRVQKRAIELAYHQVDQALQAFSQPQIPSGPAAPPGSVGPPSDGGRGGDPAALTQQLLQTQNSLLQAQNDLYNIWISYITTRMNLYRDLGLMPLDPRGVWIDEIATCQCRPQHAAPPAEQGAGDPKRSDELPAPRRIGDGEGADGERPGKLPAPAPAGPPEGAGRETLPAPRTAR